MLKSCSLLLSKIPFFLSTKKSKTRYKKTSIAPSNVVTFLSSINSDGVRIIPRVIKRVLLSSSFFRLIPFPKTARRGIITRNNTTIPPSKFPTKISGRLLATACKPTENSGVEVNIPKKIKEKAKGDSLNLLENLLAEETIRPAPNQMKKNARTYRRVFTKSTFLLYKGIDYVVNLSIQKSGEVVKRFVNAVISHAVLRKIISSYFLSPHTSSNLS